MLQHSSRGSAKLGGEDELDCLGTPMHPAAVRAGLCSRELHSSCSGQTCSEKALEAGCSSLLFAMLRPLPALMASHCRSVQHQPQRQAGVKGVAHHSCMCHGACR